MPRKDNLGGICMINDHKHDKITAAYFVNCTSCTTIRDCICMLERQIKNLNTNKIVQQKTKLLYKIQTKHQILPKRIALAGLKYRFGNFSNEGSKNED